MVKSMFFKRMFLGASMLLFSAGLVFAADDGSTLPSVTSSAPQQSRTVTVTVTDAMGPIIGANVIVRGTTNGNTTDLDGKAVIQNVPNNAVLQVSYIGYIPREVAASSANVAVTLVEDTRSLDEVVVVGYGTQAKKDITGSVSVVDAEALKETPVVTFSEALQGRASGVYISSTGAPGSPTTIRIRGVGSVNNSNPLVVVDGVSGVTIESVNPNDIESIQVLKDASATAIYGAQGANGVIIITTKQGDKGGRIRVSYEGFFGASTMPNSGFDLMNAWEAMEFVAEGMVNLRDVRKTAPDPHVQFGSLNSKDELTMPYAIKPAGLSQQQIITQFGSVDAWEKSYVRDGSSSWSRSAYYQMLLDGKSEEEAKKGSDWYDMITRSGFVTQHQLSLLGGTEKGTFSVSAGFASMEGPIIASKFERYSLRANTAFMPNKYITIGQNTNISVTHNTGERGNQGDANAFSYTYSMAPWVPVYNVGGDFAGAQANEAGRTIHSLHLVTDQQNNWTRNFRGQTALYAEVKPMEGLTFRTQIAGQLGGYWNFNFRPVDIFANKEGRNVNELEENANYRFSWQWTNTVNYTRKLDADNTITAVIGTEAIDENYGRNMRGTRRNYAYENNPNTWILNNGRTSDQTNTGTMENNSSLFGLFGRVDYSYQGKYLATLSVRRDASSKFGENNRWGTFPSLSVGWRMSDESFMESTRTWLDDFKFRAGYGTTGNSQIGANNWAFRYATGGDYSYSISGGDSGVLAGYHISNLGDPDAKWETVRTLNLGFDATAFKNRMTFSFEWYTRKTTDMLVGANWSALAGNPGKPQINIGSLQNVGWDASIGWRDRKGDFRYDLSANISTVKNKVLTLGSSNLFNSTRINNIQITTPGQPIGSFYGYKVAGLYKTVNDVLDYKNADGDLILPYGAASEQAVRDKPEAYLGRYKMENLNGDNVIDAADRTIIGNPFPDFTGGLNISLGYKNWDFSTYFYLNVGGDIYKMFEYYTHYGSLQSSYVRDRRENSWHPTKNPNGKYPLWALASGEGAEAANQSHSMYLEDGTFLRNQTLTLGYSLPRDIVSKIGLERLRFYGQVANAFLITGYTGLDPEVRSSESNYDRTRGQDFGSYGMPRQFIFGVNVSF